MQKKHSFVHDIRIATPCKADWNKMSGDQRVRFCGQCKLNVYNISEMTTEDAEKLIREKEGKLCVRMYRRNDGTLLNKDCPVGVFKRRFVAACGTVSAAVAVFAAWVFNLSRTTTGDIGFTQGQVMVVKPQPSPPPQAGWAAGGMAVTAPQSTALPVPELYLGGRHGEKD
ncbi:MAG TPA: hypothetical protein V6D22_10800 [Candidatus Obscuribacterales bacterium]